MESSINLRSYQTELIHKARELMKQGCRSILIVSPCGSGKTVLTAHMLHTAASKGMRSLFVLHRRELLRQSVGAFNKEGLPHGIISAGFTESPTMRVQIASVQTLGRRLNRQPEPSLIVWDECHHLAAASWTQIFRRFPHAYHIGLSATPQRLDGQGLGTFFKEMICGPSVSQLIADGYLSPYRLYAPMTVSVEGVHTRMGDYVASELGGVMDKPAIIGDVIAHYRKYALDKRALVFCPTIKHSQHIAAQFCAAGFQAMHVDGETDPDVRDDAIRRFRDGAIQVLTSVEIFGEGLDVPSLECVILLRATASVGIFLQQMGRALRPAPGKKEAIILDHVGNTMRHGLPDEERVWTLEGRQGRSRKSEGQVSVRVCGYCFAAMPSTLTVCKFCGWTFPIKPRKVLEREGELSEVVRVARHEQGMAQSMEELYRIGVSRGYRFPRRWASYVFKARQAKKLGRIA